jgi:hypothetical protein
MSWKDYLKCLLWGIGGTIIIELLMGSFLIIPVALEWVSYRNMLNFINSTTLINELLAIVIISLISAWRASIYSRK